MDRVRDFTSVARPAILNSAKIAQGSTARRDELLAIQEERQRLWAQEKIFEVDAPAEGESTSRPEFGRWLRSKVQAESRMISQSVD